MRILFDNFTGGNPVWFENPIEIIRCDTADQVDEAFIKIHKVLENGFWVAGFASYELGYFLESKLGHLIPENRRLPALQFGVYRAPLNADPLVPNENTSLSPLIPSWSQEVYEQAFDTVKDYICSGDIYQTNLTFPLSATLSGTPLDLYANLVSHQSVPHGAFVQVDDETTLLSRSPELFFKTDANGKIETHPMKGTQPRSSDPIQDTKAAAFLHNDPKNRAENLMIVDLLRNDLSRICEVGSVKVPKLFHVDTYTTLHQMVSHVQGKLCSNTSLGDIFRALFPCGSITGAPKIRAMEILRQLEPSPRDAYCGAIGWVAPDGSSTFNVAIRTLLCQNSSITLNVGGGVVFDSTSAGEYEEALWKTRFAQIYQKEQS